MYMLLSAKLQIRNCSCSVGSGSSINVLYSLLIVSLWILYCLCLCYSSVFGVQNMYPRKPERSSV